jgi:hypothetical protein
MLPRQPMRFLLADDPGAGKTIMAGLLIKELLIRGELERCLIVAPGSLSETSAGAAREAGATDFPGWRQDNECIDRSHAVARMGGCPP